MVIVAEDFTEAASISHINRLLSSFKVEINIDRVYDDTSFSSFNTRVLIKGDDNYPPSKGVSNILYVSGSSLKGNLTVN